jgi:aerobic carbon-monoxide dehydrogenase medium subunit
MKAPDFQYFKPATLEQALAFLGAHAEGALPLAGGQSLLPGLNMRMAAPQFLVDIGALRELQGIRLDPLPDQRRIRIGAATRHCEVLESPLITTTLPLLQEALRLVGHVAIRHRGTFGGSLAQADPAAELPACAVALDATIVLASARGRREVKANGFFTGTMRTLLQPDELITEIALPIPAPGSVCAITELSRRHGDFALAGVVARGAFDADRIREAHVAYFGCATAARPASNLMRWLEGRALPLTDSSALAGLVEADIDPTDTPGCSAGTRRHLALVLTNRILETLRRRHNGDAETSHG